MKCTWSLAATCGSASAHAPILSAPPIAANVSKNATRLRVAAACCTEMMSAITCGVRHWHSGITMPFVGRLRSHARPPSRTPRSGGPTIRIDAVGAAARIRRIVSS